MCSPDRCRKLFFFWIGLWLGPLVSVHGVDFFVALDGHDSNLGTETQPFATLERARTAVRLLKKHLGGMPPEGIQVVLRHGHYQRAHAFVLGEEDSGTKESPVVYRAYPGEKVSLIGGVQIPLADFASVSDERFLERLPVESRGKVWSVNLKQRGISDYGQLSLYGASVMQPYTTGPNPPELFVDGKAMTLARWPNAEYALVESVIEVGSILRMWQADMVGRNDRRGVYVPLEKQENPPKGFAFTVASDRPLRWTTAEDAWMFGYWYWDWSDQSVQIQSIEPQTRTIRTVQASGYGVRENQRFFAYNLLEELDAPGEWYLDRKEGSLFLFPPNESQHGAATLSLCLEPLIQMQNASYISVRGLSLGMTRGDAVTVLEGEGVVIEHCDIGDLAGKAVIISEGVQHTVRGCLVHDTGAGGLSVTGGDRQTLTPARHLVENNEITRFSRLRKTYTEGIALAGVGNRAAHNLVHDAPHAAIHFLGNDHLIECNEIHHVLMESDDAGAVYSGRRLTFWGNKIRHNYFHDILGLPPGKTRFKRILAHAVYLDDALSGIEVTANVFQRCNDAICVKGSDNRLDNNLIIDCRQSIVDHSKEPGGTYPEPLRFDRVELLPKNFDLTKLNDILSVPYSSAIWRQSYPGLAASLEQTYGAWRVSICRNVLCRTPEIKTSEWLHALGRVEGNLILSDTYPPEDISELGSWISTIPARAPGFQAIPFDQIGLRGPVGPPLP